MVDPMRSIRIDDDIWRRAKMAAAREGQTLQEWITLAILFKDDQEKRMTAGDVLERIKGTDTELHIAGEGIKR